MKQIGFVVNKSKDSKVLNRQLILAITRYCQGWGNSVLRVHPYLDILNHGQYHDSKILITIDEELNQAKP